MAEKAPGPAIAAKKEVKTPTITTKVNTLGEYSKIGEHLIIKNIPAVTIVAAWIKAETGVGPSIASGNHVCKPNWADLPTAPINKRKAITSKSKKLVLNNITFFSIKKGTKTNTTL